jgi:hypothetical protein
MSEGDFAVSGIRRQMKEKMASFLDVYPKLCDLVVKVSDECLL